MMSTTSDINEMVERGIATMNFIKFIIILSVACLDYDSMCQHIMGPRLVHGVYIQLIDTGTTDDDYRRLCGIMNGLRITFDRDYLDVDFKNIEKKNYIYHCISSRLVGVDVKD